ncbi:unnamed protein product [Amoebophrya sp. A25]|nr:unnamed protein product [Amoebophrya sp. A25]|eukprot:GSA25T00001952001.1
MASADPPPSHVASGEKDCACDSGRSAVPPFFPMVRKGCEEVSAGLFQCLSRGEPGNREDGEETLRRCDFTAYEKCFLDSVNKPGAVKPLVKVAFD